MLSSNSPPKTCFSLFLPRVELEHVDKIDQQYGDYITKVFYEQGFGVVSQVLPLIKTDPKTMVKYYCAIVHFEKWFPTISVYNFLLNLETNNSKLIHNSRTNAYWWVQKHRSTSQQSCKLQHLSAEELAKQEETRKQLAEEEAVKRKLWVEDMRRREEEYEKVMEEELALVVMQNRV